MAPTIRQLGLEMASQLVRTKNGRPRPGAGSNVAGVVSSAAGDSLKKPKKPSPVFFTARTKNFNVLFVWAKVNEDFDTFVYAFLSVFVLTVVSTIAMHVLSEFERTTLLRSRSQVTAKERVLAGLAYTARMAVLYILIVVLMSQNLWMLVSMLFGHFFGWVIFSNIDGKATEKARVRATIAALKQQQEEQKRKKEKILEEEIDLDIDEDDDDDNYSDCSSVVKHK